MNPPELFELEIGATPLTAHCFWGDCKHTESGFYPADIHDRMEDHYREKHAAQIDAILGVVR